MKTIETNRLLLRGFKKSDAQDMFEYASHPEVGPPACWKPHESLEESQKIIEMFLKDNNVWAIVEKQSGKVIGSIGISIDTRRVSDSGYYEIGYVMGKPWWGKGYMTEAVTMVVEYLFNEKGAKLISATRNPNNIRSGRVMEKLGMQKEGTLRDATRNFDGTPRDSVIYSMTREEFETQREKEKQGKS